MDFARRNADLYLAGLAAKWADNHPWFRFTPVLTEPDSDWTGRTGRVHQAVLADHPDLRGHHVYACGNPAMTAVAREDFPQRPGSHRGGSTPTRSYPPPTPHSTPSPPRRLTWVVLDRSRSTKYSPAAVLDAPVVLEWLIRALVWTCGARLIVFSVDLYVPG
jgi:hypothetical protein